MASSLNRVSERLARDMVDYVGLGFAGIESSHGVSQRDSLVEGRERAEFDPAPQCGLAHQEAGESRVGVHVGVGQQA